MEKGDPFLEYQKSFLKLCHVFETPQRSFTQNNSEAFSVCETGEGSIHKTFTPDFGEKFS